MNDYLKILINAGLAGTLVTLGAMSNGEIDFQTVYFAVIAGGIIAVTQIKEKFQMIKSKKGTLKLFSLV